MSGPTMSKPCDRKCDSQCDGCHDLNNCVPATSQYGDLILCSACRAEYPLQQPWRIDPETGEYIDRVNVQKEWACHE